jgi:hypothetical protein
VIIYDVNWSRLNSKCLLTRDRVGQLYGEAGLVLSKEDADAGSW